MKKIFNAFIILGLVASSTACKKYLDVNTNPNEVTTATPDLVMPQALAASAALSQTFNGPTYGMDLGGYVANAGGVGGFGNFWTFVFNNGDANACWNNTYDNLQDYQYIINNTATTGNYKNFNAVARLMKAIDFMRLVDAYGDVPYSQALKGSAQLQPAYDKGTDVYKACITEIDAIIPQMQVPATLTTIALSSNAAGKIDVTAYSGDGGTTSPLSGTTGKDMSLWVKFANTVKLKALIRISKVADLAAFYNTEKGTLIKDFTTSDVLINPGYVQQDGKQNPLFNALAFDYKGNGSSSSFLPSTYAVAFYDGTKLSDPGRGKLVYRQNAGAYSYKNQLGFQSTSLVANPTGGAWYSGKDTGGNPTGVAAEGYGVMKAFDQGQPILLTTESYFLQAEAALIGLIPGDPAALFKSGVVASFNYLDKNRAGVVTAGTPSTQFDTYLTNNSGSYLVNSALWASPAAADYNRDATQRALEAIITQKYIALNTLNSEEGWNDYRRTYNANLSIPGSPAKPVPSGYPFSSVDNSTANAPYSFAANFQTNTSPRADKLAGRILYPASEYSLNTKNVPATNPNSTLVFWDARPKN